MSLTFFKKGPKRTFSIKNKIKISNDTGMKIIKIVISLWNFHSNFLKLNDRIRVLHFFENRPPKDLFDQKQNQKLTDARMKNCQMLFEINSLYTCFTLFWKKVHKGPFWPKNKIKIRPTPGQKIINIIFSVWKLKYSFLKLIHSIRVSHFLQKRRLKDLFFTVHISSFLSSFSFIGHNGH